MAQETDYTKLSPEQLIELLKQKDADVSTSEKVIGELKKDLAAKDDEILAASPVPTVKIGQDTYEITYSVFKLYDVDTKEVTEYSASDVQKNEKLAAKLLKSKSEILRKIEKK